MLENIMNSSRLTNTITDLQQRPHAIAIIRGSNEYPEIKGSVRFYQTEHGVLVAAEIFGLPASEERCKSPFFAFHIHEGGQCGGDSSDPFSKAMAHYNPDNCSHPYHAGDMPPLFGNNGYALSVFLSDRFSINEVIGKTVIIHSKPDDFTTQPSGNSGIKIACGRIFDLF